MNAWFEKLYETFIASGGYQFILEGLKNTIIITPGALVIGVIIGLVFLLSAKAGKPKKKDRRL